MNGVFRVVVMSSALLWADLSCAETAVLEEILEKGTPREKLVKAIAPRVEPWWQYIGGSEMSVWYVNARTLKYGNDSKEIYVRQYDYASNPDESEKPYVFRDEVVSVDCGKLTYRMISISPEIEPSPPYDEMMVKSIFIDTACSMTTQIRFGALDAIRRRVATKLGKEWKYVESSEDFVMFAHRGVGKNGGGFRKIWTFWSYLLPQDFGGGVFLSTKQLRWVDCTNMASELRQVSYFSENFGEGEVVDSLAKEMNNKPNFKETSPGSIGRAIVAAACGKR